MVIVKGLSDLIFFLFSPFFDHRLYYLSKPPIRLHE
jgi:hypothetical protein